MMATGYGQRGKWGQATGQLGEYGHVNYPSGTMFTLYVSVFACLDRLMLVINSMYQCFCFEVAGASGIGH